MTSKRRDSYAGRPHPTDRRAKIVDATPKGKKLAKRANEILDTPPAALDALREKKTSKSSDAR